MRINKLIKKYCIDFSIEEKAVYLTSEEYIKLLGNHTITTYIGENKYVLWGAGLYTQIILKSNLIDKSKIVCIIDNDSELWGKEISGIPVKSPHVLEECETNMVFISISNSAICDAVTMQINSIKPGINIFTIDKSRNYIKNNYWSIHFDIFKLCYSFDHETDIIIKKDLAEKIIFIYLTIRDFINAFKYIDIFVSNYEDSKNYISLKNEICLLLDEIKSKLKNRETKDTLVLQYDNLRAGEIYGNTQNMPYINSLIDEGISFSRAYSPGLHTVDSVGCTFLNKNLYDFYASKDIKEKSSFIRDCLTVSNNIKLYPTIFLSTFFKKQLNESNDFFSDSSTYDTTSEVFWRALTDLCTESANSLKFLFFIKETHLPCFCGNHSTVTKDFSFADYSLPDDDFFYCNFNSPEHKQEIFDMRHAEALRYADSQTEFYLSMLSSKTIKIIFSDHSRNLQGFFLENDVKNYLIHSYSFHVPLIIHGEGVPHKVVTDVFSTVYLGDLVTEIIGKSRLPEFNQKIAEVGFSGYYNVKRRKKALSQGDMYAVNGFFLALDKDYKLVIDSEGVLHYFAMDNEEQEIFDQQLQKLIYSRLYKYIEKWRNI